MPTKAQLPGLAGKCVEFGHLTAVQAAAALREAQAAKKPFILHVLEHTEIDDRALAMDAMQAFSLPLLDVSAFDISTIPPALLKDKLMADHFVLPLLVKDKRCYVAMADPTDLKALDDIKYQLGFTAVPILAIASDLQRALKSAVRLSENTLDLSGIDLEHANTLHERDATLNIDDAPVVQLINKVLLDAIKKGASDIHFEPYEHSFRVRIRRDGVLSELTSPDVSLGPRITARLKVISQLNLSERRIPQDGRFKMNLSAGKTMDFRISTCPCLFGEKIVIRILDPTSAQMGIHALGYEPKQQELFLSAIHKPQGMVW